MNRFLAALLFAFSVAAAPAADTPAAPSAPGVSPVAPALHPTTYVLVHGAWGGGWQWKKVDILLTADGNKVYRPTLTGLGERVHLASPDLTLTTHITDIVNVILWENLRDVVLVGHSYGGMVITGVMDRVPDRIRRVIFVDAVVPNDGESLNTAFGSIPGADQIKDGFIPATWVKPGKPIPYDVPHPAKTLSEPVSYKNPAALKLPGTYLLAIDTGQTLEQAHFYKFYLRAKARGWDTVTMAANHNPEWFKPKELTVLLERAALAQPENGEGHGKEQGTVKPR